MPHGARIRDTEGGAMKRTHGTCRLCGRTNVPLDDGAHLAAHVQRYAFTTQSHCQESGKLCAEQSDDNREASTRRRLAAAERMRADAEVAHDALASGRPFPFAEVVRLRMITAAIMTYRVKFPIALEYKSRGVRAHGNASLIAIPRGRLAAGRFSSQRRENATVDVYCTLCRTLQWSGRRRAPYETEPEVIAHVTLCAMRVLAKLAEPVAPGEKRLPSSVAPSPEDF
jgi:hypothetical protein